VLKYSIVVPFHNEEENVTELYDRLKVVMEGAGEPFELVFVDDGSRDNTFWLLQQIAAVDRRVVVVKLRRNFGQTSALAAGFDHAEGEYVIAMDGDLQHDPQDIPVFLRKLREGYDIVSGWRKQRIDNFVLRRVPSKVANWLMAKLSGVELHDFGTTFKAYRRQVVQEVPLYGELHRFIPALASFYGARIAEVPISNTPRAAGDSHYGLGRTFNVMFDILTIKFLLKYFTRPMHFFGRVGLAGFVLGSVILGTLAIQKIFGHELMMVDHGPLMIAGGLLLLGGLMMFSTGLLGEVLMRTYFESQGRRIYAVREVRCRREPVAPA
jgi:glycosyltransferase involved in cell wall biosynthesis